MDSDHSSASRGAAAKDRNARKGKSRRKSSRISTRKRKSSQVSKGKDSDPDYTPHHQQPTKRRRHNNNSPPRPDDPPRIAADLKSGVCSLCKKVRKEKLSVSNWMTHLRSRHLSQCPDCPLIFTKPSYMMAHRQEAHDTSA